MTKSSNSVQNSAPILVSEHRIACDGGGGSLGHPKVYMDMGQDDQVRCKYCDRVFKLDAAHAH